MCMFRELTLAKNCTTTMLVSCEAKLRDYKSVLGNGHHYRRLLLLVTLH